MFQKFWVFLFPPIAPKTFENIQRRPMSDQVWEVVIHLECDRRRRQSVLERTSGLRYSKFRCVGKGIIDLFGVSGPACRANFPKCGASKNLEREVGVVGFKCWRIHV